MRTLAVMMVVLLSPLVAQAARVGVLPVQGTNLSPEESAAIGALMVQAFQALEPAGAVTVTAAQGADEFVETSAVRLEKRIQMQAVLRRADGAELYRASSTAESLDDIQPVVERIARSLHERKPFAETQTLHNVTAREA